MKAAREVFLQRAGDEARRYGSDPWVFLRELIQNARDAGAASVEVRTGGETGREWVEVRDDGEGMDGDRARRFLFTLYASSKRDGSGAAGRFGVGFWSVLRFAPDRIELRSVPRAGAGWRVVLDGRLAPLEEGGCSGRPGTTVRLERPGTGAGLSSAVTSAVWDTARFVSRKGSPARRLAVAVDGRDIAEPFTLPSPSLAFQRDGLRGVVALGVSPRVELFAFGLKVRAAATLEELLGEGRFDEPAARHRDRPGLAPVVLLDSDRLELLLARGDAREDRHLRRLVGCARYELDRLLRLELDRRSRRGPAARIADRVVGVLSSRRGRGLAAGLLVAAALGLAIAEGVRRTAPLRVEGPGPAAAAVAVPAPERPYRDLGAAYRGPDVGLGPSDQTPVALRYLPADRDLLLAVLRLDGLALEDPGRASALRPAAAGAAGGDSLELSLELAAASGVVRLPVPTGMAVLPESVTLGGTPVGLFTTARDEPALVLEEPVAGTVRYRVRMAAADPEVVLPRWPDLPAALMPEAVRLAALDPRLRPGAAEAAVRERIAYDRSPETAARHRAARASGDAVVARALAVGAGDCDVQNAVLAALLAASGTPARLAVGFVGLRGSALPGLHAWVEYLAPDGRWRPADASAVATAARARDVGREEEASTAAAGDARRSITGWPIAVGSGLLGLALVAAAVRRRSRRQVELGDDLDLAAVIRGAVERPEAWAGLAALDSRPLIPCRNGRRVSIRRARRLAGRGRLLRAATRSSLEQRALDAGATVVDTGRPEGAAAVEGLPAVDLDWWQQRLAVPRPAPLEALQASLSRSGIEVRLAVAGQGEPPARLELDGLGLGRGVAVAVDPEVAAARPADAVSETAALALLAWLERELGASLAPDGDGRSRLARAALGPGGRR